MILSLCILLLPFVYLWLREAVSSAVTPNPDGLVCSALALAFTLAALYQGFRAVLCRQSRNGIFVMAFALVMLFVCVALLFPVFARSRLRVRLRPRLVRPALPPRRPAPPLGGSSSF